MYILKARRDTSMRRTYRKNVCFVLSEQLPIRLGGYKYHHQRSLPSLSSWQLTKKRSKRSKVSPTANIFSEYLIICNIAKLKQREDHIRESWVKAMEVRLVREELAKCHQAEGVNHYENCSWLSQKYLNMLKENRVRCLVLILFKI